MAHFLDIAPELVIHIFSYLSLSDLVSASQTHSAFYNIIATSRILQYPFAANAAGVEDNPLSSHNTIDRLAILKNSEEGWNRLQFDFHQTIHIRPGIFPLRYDSTSGIYFFTNMHKTTLYYCKLPSNVTDTATWSGLHIGHTLLEIGISIYENDLIAIFTTTAPPTVAADHVIELRLLQFSTGNPHPLANNHVFFTQALSAGSWSQYNQPRVQISGDILALSTGFPRVDTNDTWYLSFYNWKDASLKLQISEFSTGFPEPIFLSANYILLLRQGSLDIWALEQGSQSTQSPNPLLLLTLPLMPLPSMMYPLSCTTSTATFTGAPYSPRPFHALPEKRILLLNMTFIYPVSTCVSFFVHSKALLNLVHSGATGRLQWSSWGPLATRCFHHPGNPGTYKVVSDGSRVLVFGRRTTAGSPNFKQVELHLLDFNQMKVRRMLMERDCSLTKSLATWTAEMLKGFSRLFELRPSSDVGQTAQSRNTSQQEQDGPVVVTKVRNVISGAFQAPVKCKLPYIRVRRRLLEDEHSDFDNIIMDEEKLVMTKLGVLGALTKIRVLHIGVGDRQMS